MSFREFLEEREDRDVWVGSNSGRHPVCRAAWAFSTIQNFDMNTDDPDELFMHTGSYEDAEESAKMYFKARSKDKTTIPQIFIQR